MEEIIDMCVCVLSRVRLFVTPWTVARQAPTRTHSAITDKSPRILALKGQPNNSSPSPLRVFIFN